MSDRHVTIIANVTPLQRILAHYGLFFGQ